MQTPLTMALSAACAICCAAAAFGCAPVHAQSYPSKPIRVVVPFSAGGGTDVVARLIGQKLSIALGQQIIVETRAGAAGRLGTDYVAHAAPDGYTLLMTTTTTIISAPALFPKLPYESPKDFAPIGPVCTSALVLVAHPSVPARSVKELITLARTHPGKLNFASSGPGDTNHLSGELFQIRAGVRMVHVPYKGAAPATLSVIMGETDLMFTSIILAIPPSKSGQLRALGITSLTRSPMLPEVPTVAESSLPGFEVENFYALLAPAGTPKEIVRRLHDETVKAVALPDIKERLEADGSRILVSSPEELEKVIVTEIAKWSKVIQQAGIKPPAY